VRWLAATGWGLAFGVPAGVVVAVAEIVAGPVGLFVGIVVAGTAFVLVFPRTFYPSLCRRSMQRQLDPAAAPPADTEPAELALPHRMAAVLTARDWDGLRGLVAENLTVRVPPRERSMGPGLYLRGARLMARAYPDLRMSVEAVVARPAEPGTVWVRFAEVGHAWRGPTLDAAWWERWELTDERDRVQRIELVGVTRLA
jgi:hypothetical protein